MWLPVSSDSCFSSSSFFLAWLIIYLCVTKHTKKIKPKSTTHCFLFLSFPGLQIKSIGAGREAAASLQHTDWNPSRSHQSGEVSCSRSVYLRSSNSDKIRFPLRWMSGRWRGRGLFSNQSRQQHSRQVIFLESVCVRGPLSDRGSWSVRRWM